MAWHCHRSADQLHGSLLQVNRPDVQRVLLTALLEDPNFQDLLQDRNQACNTLLAVLFSLIRR